MTVYASRRFNSRFLDFTWALGRGGVGAFASVSASTRRSRSSRTAYPPRPSMRHESGHETLATRPNGLFRGESRERDFRPPKLRRSPLSSLALRAQLSISSRLLHLSLCALPTWRAFCWALCHFWHSLPQTRCVPSESLLWLPPSSPALPIANRTEGSQQHTAGRHKPTLRMGSAHHSLQ